MNPSTYLASAFRFVFATVYLAGWVSGGLVFAQPEGGSAKELPRELSAAKLKYAVKLEQLQQPLRTLVDRYKGQIVKMRDAYKTAGELEGLLATRKEIESIENTGRPQSERPSHAGLEKTRKIYEKEIVRIEADIADTIDSLNTAHRRNLEAIQKKLVRERRLEDALAVRTYAKTIPKAPKKTAARPAPAPKGAGSLRVKVQIDESSLMYICGDEIWFDHRKGKGGAPGRHKGILVATELNGKKWMPVWNEDITLTEKHDAKIGLPDWGTVELKYTHRAGRGQAVVASQPGRNNRYTAKIEIHDVSTDGSRFSGSQFVEFDLNW